MNHSKELETLVNINTRQEDGWVNATKWCEYYGKRWSDYSRLKDFKRYLEALQEKLSGKTADVLLYKSQGKPKQVWIHPLVAIHLAQWLSPEFHVYVNEVFKRYIEGDITLADEILQRQTDQEKVEWLAKRAEGKIVRMGLTKELNERGITQPWEYANCTDAINIPLLGGTAKEIRDSLGLTKGQKLRDKLPKSKLIAIQLAEALAQEQMQQDNTHGYKPCKDVCPDAGKKVKRVFD